MEIFLTLIIVNFFFEIRETNTAKTRKIIDALFVVKKLPVVLSGKNSVMKIKKNGKVLASRASKLISNGLIFLKKILKIIMNTKTKTILKPIKPSSLIISR